MGTNLLPFLNFFFVSNIADLFDNRGEVVGVCAPEFTTLTSPLTVAFKRVLIRWLISSRLWFISDFVFEHNAKHNATAYNLSVTYLTIKTI